ncbi:MAG: HAD family hydrolase [bacterium]|nr:HAD family hydrolase [bacterium]
MERDHGMRRIKLVTVDANGTAVTPRNSSSEQLLLEAFQEILGRKFRGRKIRKMLWSASRESKLALAETVSDDVVNTDPYWVQINEESAAAIGITLTKDQALQIHCLIDGEVDRFGLSLRRRRFLYWLCRIKFKGGRGVSVVILSNSLSHVVERLLVEHGVNSLFQRVYTPEVLLASKPAKKVVDEVCARSGVTPGEILHVGNSPVHDLRLVLWGVNVALITTPGDAIDAKEEFAKLKERGLVPEGTLFYSSCELGKVKAWIDAHFVGASEQQDLFGKRK